jgi:hybrid cluster-associated redox disulfide protein
MKQIITKNMKIQDIIEKYPKTIEILINSGIHCLGCHASYFETLGEGFKLHNITDKEINKILKRMNNLIKK